VFLSCEYLLEGIGDVDHADLGTAQPGSLECVVHHLRGELREVALVAPEHPYARHRRDGITPKGG